MPAGQTPEDITLRLEGGGDGIADQLTTLMAGEINWKGRRQSGEDRSRHMSPTAIRSPFFCEWNPPERISGRGLYNPAGSLGLHKHLERRGRCFEMRYFT